MNSDGLHITMLDKNCRGCIFAGKHSCDFYLKTGYRRAKICKPGIDCTIKSSSLSEYRRKFAELVGGDAPIDAHNNNVLADDYTREKRGFVPRGRRGRKPKKAEEE